MKIKVGQKLYLKKENIPMDLKVGDYYGMVTEVEGNNVTVENIIGKFHTFVNDGRNSVFNKWFTTQNKEKKNG